MGSSPVAVTHAICCRFDNPTVHDFGYNDNVVKNQFSSDPLEEMCKVMQENLIWNEPLPKQRK